ncbi:lysine--tRNA ligase [candidate division WOR-3 bacterium JGI_Cruoil_03_44_89]|uniref:Lysine--tRNA ligase n=1 Tax=candidate division WOR-3 bacterium JGI_Cruoil_03_44_89 TaxID=1973748 RepID=A0A235BYY1_UNCW3|nr:MAG: lysine--tRNA ligase [candidate division WOR-3 bacterium JGI_Cruoil_03_44_89]
MFTSEQEKIRIAKLLSIIEKGINPYPKRFDRTHTVGEIKRSFCDGKDVRVAGRLVALRKHGKSTFGNILDDGEKIQIYLKKDMLGEKYSLLEFLDIGDFLGIRGNTFTTHTGEPTILVEDLVLLSKSISPLPEKWHGLQDKELRYRRRYIDFIVNPESRGSIETRAKILRLTRKFLDDRGFLEIETPILQPLYGGAFAEPFKTHYRALDREFFMRISDELYLKRLICGGFNKVYEIGRDFRNEGQDRLHNPEFTQLELYEAYKDYTDIKNLVEELFSHLTQNLYGSRKINYGELELDFASPWETIPYFDAIAKYTNYDLYNADYKYVRRVAEQLKIDVSECSATVKSGKNLTPSYIRDKLIDKIFGDEVIPMIEQPTFITDYPKSISPLAKEKEDNPDLVERFEPVIAGIEIGNAFSELNDPLEQQKRFMEQMSMREEGDKETQPLDEDFLKALGMGMPPTGGLGLGMDRISMILSNSSTIKDVIAFPQMRW